MDYYHVIAKLDGQRGYRVLFADLNLWNLRRDFIKPYDRGKAFFVGNELIESKTIREVQIVLTDEPEEVVRKEINRLDNERIDAMNRSSSGLFFVTFGAGHDPEDIAMGGKDVTKEFVKGPPGHRERTTLFRWAVGAITALIIAGIVKFLGWN